MIGTVGSPQRAVVDPCGLVTPGGAGWSLDWWIGAEDRWHVPAREVAVRQRLIDHAPVIETAVRVPGGDAVERVYAFRPAVGPDLVVVEVDNNTPVPFAVALAIRPANHQELGWVERIELAGSRVLVDGVVAAVFPSAPRKAVLSTLAGGDGADAVFEGAAGDARFGSVHCPDGLAQAALIWPLAHGATFRAQLPLPAAGPPPGSPPRRPAARRGHRFGRALDPTTSGPAVPPGAATQIVSTRVQVPAGADVARSWRAQAERSLRFELPPGPLADALAAVRPYLLLQQAGLPHRDAGTDVARTVVALDQAGYSSEAGEVLARWAEDLRGGGRRGRGAGQSAFLWAADQHRRLAPGWVATDRMLATVAAVAETVAGDRRGSSDESPVTQAWSVAGWRAAGDMLARGGQRRAAATAAAWATQGCARLEVALAAALGTAVNDPTVDGGAALDGGAGLDGGAALDSGAALDGGAGLDAAIGALLASGLLALVGSDHPVVVAARSLLRRRSGQGGLAEIGPSAGLSPTLTLWLAEAELAAGERGAFHRLDWVLAAATPTWTWPDVVCAASGSGGPGDGHSAAVTAAMWTFGRNLLVGEGPGEVRLCTALPDSWQGRGFEVHRAPTGCGLVSYAVRWHGERPAILWEIEGPPTLVRVRAPGLDAGWSATTSRGEALLAPSMPVPPASRR